MAEAKKPDRLVAELSPSESRAVDEVIARLGQERGRTVTRKELTMEGVRDHASRLGVTMAAIESPVRIGAAEVARFKESGGNKAPFLPARLSAVLGYRHMSIRRLSRLLRSQWSSHHMTMVIRGVRTPSAALYLSLKRWLGDAYHFTIGSTEVLPMKPARKAKGVRA